MQNGVIELPICSCTTCWALQDYVVLWGPLRQNFGSTCNLMVQGGSASKALGHGSRKQEFGRIALGASGRLCCLWQGILIRTAHDLLVPELSHDSEAKLAGDIRPQEVGLGPDVGHDLSPLGHHGIALALHLVGTRIQQNWVLPDQLSSLL